VRQGYLLLDTRGLNKSLCFLFSLANDSSSGTVTVQPAPGHICWGQHELVGKCNDHRDKEIQRESCLIVQCNYIIMVLMCL
jgi:hypothetical protein